MGTKMTLIVLGMVIFILVVLYYEHVEKLVRYSFENPLAGSAVVLVLGALIWLGSYLSRRSDGEE